MKKLRFISIIYTLLLVLLTPLLEVQAQQNETKNILFVIVDDLRLQAGVFGQDQMITPNIDEIGQEGLVFNRAYCQVPTCGASRASFLTGLYPTRQRFTNYRSSHDKDAPEVSSLPMWFKKNGYTTISLGKVYHNRNDDLHAWSKKPYRAESDNKYDYHSDENRALFNEHQKGLAFDKANVGDGAYKDGKMTELAIETLQELSQSDNPFFLAVGFQKPHLPFNAPAQYWDLYERKNIKLADNPYPPKGAPVEAIFKNTDRPDVFNSTELRMWFGIPEAGDLHDSIATSLVHGYYACVSYIDKLLGDIISELERLDLDKNTAVVLIGDHGFHLGEHRFWSKHCVYDRVLNTPLIIKAPGKAANVKTNTIAEYVDLYPTFCELAGLDLPNHLDGKSLVPVLGDPGRIHKEQAFSRFGKGETIITEKYMYTEYRDKDGKLISKMLTDLEKDPKQNENIIWQYEENKVLKELENRLREYQK